MTAPDRTQALLIGGRAGVGKSTVAAEVSRLLIGPKVRHCLIEGDNLCAAFPAPPDDPRREAMTEANLCALWANYRVLGYRRLIYANTACVVDPAWIERPLGGEVDFTGVLLQSGDETTRRRLETREIGSGLDWHVRRSGLAAAWLAENAEPWVSRVETEGRTVAEIASEVVALAGWL